MSRDFTQPPEALPPERLWRSLLPARPFRALRLRLRGAERVQLIVRPVTAMGEALARDAGAALEVEQLRYAAAVRELLALVVHTQRRRAFATAADLAALEDHELAALEREVMGALSDIAPTYARSDVDAWSTVLQVGAAHPSNLSEASAIASCIALSSGSVVPRPDRYWPLSISELLDGHWMAWNAARAAVKDRK
jgi:hypothetical protein